MRSIKSIAFFIIVIVIAVGFIALGQHFSKLARQHEDQQILSAYSPTLLQISTAAASIAKTYDQTLFSVPNNRTVATIKNYPKYSYWADALISENALPNGYSHVKIQGYPAANAALTLKTTKSGQVNFFCFTHKHFAYGECPQTSFDHPLVPLSKVNHQ